jgi:Na+/H+ antiporter NhaC
MNYGILSIIPPVLALFIAIKFKKVSLALLVGTFLCHLILKGWNPFSAVDATVNGVLGVWSSADNLKIFLFTSLMGAFVLLVRVSGGVEGFVSFLTEKNKTIKSKRGAMLLTYVIGVIIFIDGLMSIMFTGVISRPIFDKLKISREKLSYICDSTSAPINAIIPLNSWGAMLMGLIGVQIAAGVISGDPMILLVQSLPFQFYSIVALIVVLVSIITGKDLGPMKKAEQRVETTGKLYDEGVIPLLKDDEEDASLVARGKENKNNMAIPLIILIVGTFAGLLISGHGSLIKGDGSAAIMYAIIVTLLYMCISYKVQKIMTAKQFGLYVYKGVSGMLSLVVLLSLAFAIGRGVSALGTGSFLAGLIGERVSGAFGPVIVFILGVIISFCTGTSWGTFSIMMPIAIPLAVGMDANILLTISAVISGGIFGDHCSPLSDTTILSSMSAGTDLYSHVRTQLPYALISAGIAAVLYVIFGFIM